MTTLKYKLTPVGRPRETQRDKWGPSKAVQRYRAYRDKVKLLKVKMPKAHAEVTFVLPMPLSWSKAKKKRMVGGGHEQTPDLDNLLKGLMDAIYYKHPEGKKDSEVWNVKGLTKLWGYDGTIYISWAVPNPKNLGLARL